MSAVVSILNPEEISTLSEKEYRAFPVESFSSIKYILESKDAFLYYKNKPFKGSDATLLGTTVHHFLQGNKHLVAYSVIDKRKKEEYAKFQEEFLSLAGDEGIIVPKSFEEKVSSIMANLNSNDKALQLLDGCQFETPYFFEVEGLQLKGKVDGVCDEYMLEIKTSSQATTAREFKEEAQDRHYDMQAAMYLYAHTQVTGCRPPNHYFIVVNTTAPFKVAVYKSSKEFLKEGEKKLYEAVNRYKKYIINNEEYEDEIESI